MKKKQKEKTEGLVVRLRKIHPDTSLTSLENVEVVTPKQDLTFELLDAHIDTDEYKIKIISSRKWYVRLWYLLTNPFCYLFAGYNRY